MKNQCPYCRVNDYCSPECIYFVEPDPKPNRLLIPAVVLALTAAVIFCLVFGC